MLSVIIKTALGTTSSVLYLRRQGMNSFMKKAIQM